jgi:hypothetical protein
MKKHAKTSQKAGREITQDASADRSLPEIRAILGTAQRVQFHPENIQGEPISVTVLRERR